MSAVHKEWLGTQADQAREQRIRELNDEIAAHLRQAAEFRQLADELRREVERLTK